MSSQSQQPQSTLPGGAQDDPDGVRLEQDASLAVDEDYPEPDGDSEQLEVEDGEE